ncbi:MAG: class B sortase [Eubacteriales bacterium]|nr:class B sortase [Eubacteriales bacterium]
MNQARVFLKIANGVISAVIVISLLLAGAYAAYALWDNSRIYASADDVQREMLKLKPELPETSDSGPTFAELLEINGDICAWVTVDNTPLDYPVVQGETNLSYINTDVYGNFALAGSVFLDSRNDRDFRDSYSLLYGHDMIDYKMFGALELFKDEVFFNQNNSGTLILPDRVYDLKIFACLLLAASDDYIFEPQVWQTDDIDKLLTYTSENAMYVDEKTIQELRGNDDVQVLALSTCSAEFINARTILLAAMVPH